MSFYANYGIALALVQGAYPKRAVFPTQILQSSLETATQLGLPNILTNMTLTQFRTAKKLDLSEDLR